MRESLYAYCLRSGETALLSQWDAGGNGTLTPQSIPYGSKQKVWWQCPKGHEWQAIITSRANNGAGCPVCAGKVNQRNQVRYRIPPEQGARKTPARKKSIENEEENV